MPDIVDQLEVSMLLQETWLATFKIDKSASGNTASATGDVITSPLIVLQL